jgi:predicted TIM-barrel enzyme
VLLGSGATPENLQKVYHTVDGLIVGSTLKHNGQAENVVEEARVKAFTDAMQGLANSLETPRQAS